MSKALTARTNQPARRRYSLSGNTMTFPSELRAAIPDLPTCVGRALEVAEIDGDFSETLLAGRRVRLRFTVRETGKLTGKFAVLLDLEPKAARKLAETLASLAAEAGA